MDLYSLIKTLHIVSATIVFGTGIGIANFMFFGHRGGQAQERAFAARMTVRADFLFTLPSGHVADNYSRKLVVLWMQIIVGIACAGLALVSALPREAFAGEFWQAIGHTLHMQPDVLCMLGCMMLFGAARTYLWASSASFMPRSSRRGRTSSRWSTPTPKTRCRSG